MTPHRRRSLRIHDRLCLHRRADMGRPLTALGRLILMAAIDRRDLHPTTKRLLWTILSDYVTWCSQVGHDAGSLRAIRAYEDDAALYRAWRRLKAGGLGAAGLRALRAGCSR